MDEQCYALLIDADNVSAKYIKPILTELSKYCLLYTSSFAIHLKGYTATFLIMLLFSLIISTIISTGRKQARESTKQMYRTQLLLDNSRRMRRVDTCLLYTSSLRIYNGIVAFILFVTVLFANFAESVAEGRGRHRQRR